MKTNLKKMLLYGVVIGLIIFLINGCAQVKKVDISSKTPHSIGAFEGTYMHALKGQSGVLVYGPYWNLEYGNYRVTYSINAVGTLNQEAAIIDINAFDKKTSTPSSITKSKVVVLDSEKWRNYTLDFCTLKNNNILYEFRVISNGFGDIKVRSITVQKL